MKGNNTRKVIIIGKSRIAKKLNRFFKAHPETGYKVIAKFHSEQENIKIKPLTVKEISSFVKDNKIDEIYCCMQEMTRAEINELIEFSNRNLIRIKILSEDLDFNPTNYKRDYYGDIPVLIPKILVLDELGNSLSKRIFDIVFSFLFIVLILSWLFPILAIIISIDSRGPIIFKQNRSGFNNRDFYCFKFRSMYVGDKTNGSFKQATKGDPRITRVGGFLRRTSLDELPQFFNVFIGDMSLIGPRPHPVEMTKQYNDVLSNYMLRHSVKPGISGMSQVFGFRGETKELSQMKNRVTMDIFYIENWSILLDIKIAFWTVKSLIVGQEEAY